MSRLPVLCVDFDGVIHSYDRGWQNGEIYGEVTEGFWEWLEEAVMHFTVTVYSSRSKTPEGIRAMYTWLLEKVPADKVVTLTKVEFASEKPPAFLTIDDRAVMFGGNWAILSPEKLLEFKPWNVE